MNKKKTFRDVAAEVPEHIKRLVRLQYNIALRMRAMVEQSGKTQKEIARDIGMSESQLSDILSGEVNMTMKTIARFEAYFDEEIIGISAPKKTSRSRSSSIKSKTAV